MRRRCNTVINYKMENEEDTAVHKHKPKHKYNHNMCHTPVNYGSKATMIQI